MGLLEGSDPSFPVAYRTNLSDKASDWVRSARGSPDYSKSFDFGFRPGSFDKKPKIKSETKKITTV